MENWFILSSEMFLLLILKIKKNYFEKVANKVSFLEILLKNLLYFILCYVLVQFYLTVQDVNIIFIDISYRVIKFPVKGFFLYFLILLLFIIFYCYDLFYIYIYYFITFLYSQLHFHCNYNVIFS